jgi:hypothetical protein
MPPSKFLDRPSIVRAAGLRAYRIDGGDQFNRVRWATQTKKPDREASKRQPIRLEIVSIRAASTSSWSWLNTIPHHTLPCSESEHGIGKKSASQVSSSWHSHRSWVLTKNDAPLPSFNRACGMPALPERGYVASLRVEQGAPAVQDCVDSNNMAVFAVEAQPPIASPC